MPRARDNERHGAAPDGERGCEGSRATEPPPSLSTLASCGRRPGTRARLIAVSRQGYRTYARGAFTGRRSRRAVRDLPHGLTSGQRVCVAGSTHAAEQPFRVERGRDQPRWSRHMLEWRGSTRRRRPDRERRSHAPHTGDALASDKLHGTERKVCGTVESRSVYPVSVRARRLPPSAEWVGVVLGRVP